jgi:hypothetical protein
MNNRNLAYDEAAQRQQLIAFYQAESPWMVQKLECLRNGYPLTPDDRRVLAGLNAALAA